MPVTGPVCLPEVLAEEYQALRSESSYAPLDPSRPDSALAELFQKVHRDPKPFSALCISGGGIRSATFALGALQSMADKGYLGEFDYLSTVSGGGYIGSWLTAWIHRKGGLSEVVPKLKTDAPKPVGDEVDPIQHLRDYNNYLTPKLGLFSADTWTVAATVIRNMVLNWLVLVPLLLFALMAPRLVVSVTNLNPDYWSLPAPAWWPLVMRATLFLTYALFSLGVYNAVRYLPTVGKISHTQGDFLLYVLAPLVTSYILHCAYYWWSKDPTTFLLEVRHGLISAAAGWLAYLLIYEAFEDWKGFLRQLFGPISIAILLVGVGVGLFSWILLVLIYPIESIDTPQFVAMGPPLLLLGFSLAGALFVGLTSSTLEDQDREWFSRAGAWLTLVIIGWAAICSLVLLVPEIALNWPVWMQSLVTSLGAVSGWSAALAGFSGKSKAVPEARPTKSGSWPVELALKLAAPTFLILLFAALALLSKLIVDSTEPLQVAWLGRFVIVQRSLLAANAILALLYFLLGMVSAYFININLFSLNSMYRNRLVRAYLGASNQDRKPNPFTGFDEKDNLPMSEIDTQHKPFHILNLTLNLVAGKKLAWQQRKAESFTVSPLHCGSQDLGYRPSAEYGDKISLGQATAISGAAASPNMGYHSSPVVGFIMTLFNARLGAWLGNPGEHGDKTWTLRGPQSAVGSLVKEAFGLTDNTSEYVYLSDGGHFENLGLYEMVRRRCRYIVVLDSGCDQDFTYEDLGNAIRKIRIDLNIPITFPDALDRPLREKKKRCAVASIGYSNVDGQEASNGFLIYVKPMCLGNESPDVQSYQCQQIAFPHQSTADQWFNESQTESYRMLGQDTMDEISHGMKEPTLESLRLTAEEYIRRGMGGKSTAAGAP
jgi:hypothetical protein